MAVAAFQQHDAANPLHDFFENGSLALHLVGPDGTILRANKAELDLLGYPAEEYIGRNIAEFHADEDTICDILGRLTHGERLDQYPARLKARNGSIKYVLISSSVNFQNGKFINTRCFTIDVTEQKAVEARLREHDQRLAATYSHANIGIAEADESGRLLRVNKTLSTITGFSEAELLTRTFFDHTHSDDLEPDRTHYRQQIAGERDAYTVEKRYVRKNGEIAWVCVNASAVRDARGRFLYGIRVIQDITDQKNAAEIIQDRERWFRELLYALPAAVYTTDAEGRINFYNPAAVELAGREPALGDMWCVTWKLYRPDGSLLPHDQCPMAIALKEQRPVCGAEAIAERPDGTRVPFIPFPTPLRDAGGRVIGAVNMLVDISERRQSETAQQILIRELNHRVKNNMQMLDSLLKLAIRKTQTPEAKAVLEDASRRVATMAAAQRVLYESGPMTFGADEFLHAVSAASAQAFQKDVEIVIAEAEGTLSNDAAIPLALILNELLVNAVKHGVNGRGKGAVRIGLRNGSDECIVYVEDDGPGFDLKQAKRHSGLDIVTGLARQIGGTFSVELLGATRCSVRFPAAVTVH